MEYGSCGTIFSIYKKTTTGFRPVEIKDILQSGDSMSAAGYCLYGQSTQIVLTAGYRVNGYTLDTSLGEFILSHPRIPMPNRHAIYSIDEAKSHLWSSEISTFLEKKKRPRNKNHPAILRFTGSLVADVHRTLLYGGILMYPATILHPDGEINIFDACAMAQIIEELGARTLSALMVEFLLLDL